MSVDRLNRAISIIQALMSSALALFAVVFKEMFIVYVQNKGVLAIFFLLIFFLTIRTTEAIVEISIKHLSLVRRLLMGPEDIEGPWLDYIIWGPPDGPGTLRWGGFLTIYFQDGQFVVDGDGIYPDGRISGTFKCNMTNYSDARLRYGYEAFEAETHSKFEGFGEYCFLRHGGKLVSFSGSYFDNNQTTYAVFGDRLTRQLLKNLDPDKELRNFTSPEVRAMLVKRYLEFREARSLTTTLSAGGNPKVVGLVPPSHP